MGHSPAFEGRRSIPGYKLRRRQEADTIRAQAGFTSNQLQVLREQWVKQSRSRETTLSWEGFLEQNKDKRKFPAKTES